MRLFGLVAVAVVLLTASCKSGSGSTTPTSGPAASQTASPAAATRTPTPAAEPTIDPSTAATNDVHLPGTPQGSNLTDVRIGLHPELGGWDRIVFEFEGPLPEVDVGYVTSVLSCGPGLPVPVQGQAILAVRLFPSNAHNEQGQLTVPATTIPGQGGVILETKEYCDFEAVVQWAIGLKAKQPFKVTTLTSPTRLVVDIKQ